MSDNDSIASMRIAVLVERYEPTGGGAERSTAQVVDRLVERGHRVTVLTGSAEEGLDREGLTIEAMSERRSSSPMRLWKLVRWARERLNQGGFDASLSMTTSLAAQFVEPRAGLVSLLQERTIARRDSAAARVTKRLLLMMTPKQILLRRAEDQTLRDPSVQRFIAISDYMAEQLRDEGKIEASRIAVIRNGAEMPVMDEAQRVAARADLANALNINNDTTVFLFAANDPQRKGIVPLLRALQLLRDREAPVVVLVVGGYTFKLNRMSAEMGVRDQVRWLGSSRHMPELYAAADATVLPTFYDPASKVIIESLMMGTPAITTAYNGASDFIRNPTGEDRGVVLAEADDAVALADAMAAMCDPVRREACRAAIAPIAYELTMDRHVDELERLLSESRVG